MHRVCGSMTPGGMATHRVFRVAAPDSPPAKLPCSPRPVRSLQAQAAARQAYATACTAGWQPDAESPAGQRTHAVTNITGSAQCHPFASTKRGQVYSQASDGARGRVALHAGPVVARVAALHPAVQRVDAAGIGDRLLLRQQRRHCKGNTIILPIAMCCNLHLFYCNSGTSSKIFAVRPMRTRVVSSPSLGLKLPDDEVGAAVG